MFIIERRTAGVLVALAIAAAMVVLGNIAEPVAVVDTATTANSTPAFATSAEPGVRPIAFAANEAQTARARPEISQSK
jgi:hypothetical protein